MNKPTSPQLDKEDSLSELEKIYQEYSDECTFTKRLREETIRGYQTVFQTFTRIMPEIVACEQITPACMREFFKRLQTRERIVGANTKKMGVKNSTIRTYWSKLNSFFIWMITNGYIEINPVAGMKPPDPTYEDKRALTKLEIQKIIASILLNADSQFLLKRDISIVYVLIFCGLRKGELISLNVMDVDIDKGLLTVIGKTSKSKKTRYIPMNPNLKIQLIEYLKERNKLNYKSEKLFVSRNLDNGITTHGMKHWVKRIRKQSGVNFHLHRFRHTFASNLGNKNVSAVKIQKLMGHKDIRMTMTYLRSISSKDMRDEILKLNINDFI